MDCQTANEYMSLYADGMLGSKEAERLLAHIGSCGRCKKEFDGIIAVKKALSGLKEIEPPAGLALSAVKKAKKRSISVFAYASAGIAAAIALVSIFSSNLINNGDEIRQNKAVLPSVYSLDITAGDGIQAECAPQEADLSFAPAPLPTAAPDADDIKDNNESTVMRSASVPFIDVPAGISDDFRESLKAFLSENNIDYDIYENSDYYKISFTITQDKLDGLKSLIDQSLNYGSYEYEEEIKAGLVSFIFSK